MSLGCPPCSCNVSGSIENFCDTHTGQCPCKMGVEGLQCDECTDGFYGISTDGCQGNLFSEISKQTNFEYKFIRCETNSYSFLIIICCTIKHYKSDKFIPHNEENCTSFMTWEVIVNTQWCICVIQIDAKIAKKYVVSVNKLKVNATTDVFSS